MHAVKLLKESTICLRLNLSRTRDYEILYFTDNVDEFAIKMLMNYNEKEFKSVSAGDLDIDTPEEKEEIKAKEEDAKDMFKFMEEKLSGKVKSVSFQETKNTPCYAYPAKARFP